MVGSKDSKNSAWINKSEHIGPEDTGDNIAAKKVALYVDDGNFNGNWVRMTQPGGSGGGGTQYTDGSTTVTHPIGTIPVFDDSGTIVAVSTANPLPVDATFSGTVTSAPTFKDDPTDALETPKFGKTNSTTHKQQVEADTGLVQPTTPSDTQPISAASLPLPTGAATSAKQLPDNHNVVVTSAPTTAVTGPLTDTQLRASAVPVSGTVTANAGTNLNTSALALETGGNLAAIKADVDKIPSQGQALAAGSMPVVLPAAQITSLTPPSNTGYALDTSVNSLLKPASTLTKVSTVDTITNVVHVDDNSGSITVDGAVTVNAGTNLNTSALALDATLTNKTQFTKITNGTNTATVAASGELSVVPKDGNGVYLTDGVGVTVSLVKNLTGGLTDRSGSITTGGTAQTLAATNNARNYLLIQNNSSEDLWFNFAVTAVASQPSIQLPAGSTFTMENNFASGQSISIIGATTGQTFTAKEG